MGGFCPSLVEMYQKKGAPEEDAPFQGAAAETGSSAA